jgi:hypothetical protein
MIEGTHIQSNWNFLNETQIPCCRFTSLQDSMEIRKENLDGSLALHQLLRDIEEQAAWVTEKAPLACSEELGSNLDEVKTLQRKHQVHYDSFLNIPFPSFLLLLIGLPILYLFLLLPQNNIVCTM